MNITIASLFIVIFLACFDGILSLDLLLVLSLSLGIHIGVNKVNNGGNNQAKVQINILEIKPIVHVIEISLVRCIDSLWGYCVLNEPGNIACKSDSHKVVHLEKETEGSLLELVDN